MLQNPPKRKHTASVVLINQSGRLVRSVCLHFQNGKGPMQRQTWSGIYPTEMAPSTMKVQYESGSKLFANDQKWLLTWHSRDFKTLHSTSDELLPNTDEIRANLGKQRAALHRLLYQPLHEENSGGDDYQIPKSLAELATNSIMEGMQSSFLTKTKFKLSPMDDMEKQAVVYFVIRDDGKVVMTCRSGRQLFDVSKQSTFSRRT